MTPDPRKALVVAFYFPPANAPAAQHADWFFRYLPLRGIQTWAVTSALHYPDGFTPVRDPQPNVVRIPGTRHAKFWEFAYHSELSLQLRLAGFWEPGFLWAELCLPAARRIIRENGIGSLVSVSPSVAGHWAAWRLKAEFPELTWVADFTDPLVGNPFRRSGQMGAAFEEWFEGAIFSTADWLSANTSAVQAMWARKYPDLTAKFVLTSGGYDPAEVIESTSPPLRKTPVIRHVGAVYGGRVPNALFDSLARLHASGRLSASDIRFEFQGPMDRGYLQNSAQFDALCEVGLVRLDSSYVPRTEALRLTLEADYLLLLDLNGLPGPGLQVPSKVFDYIRVGRPMLAFTGAGSPTADILAGAGIPYVEVDSAASPETVDEAILESLTLPRCQTPPTEWFLDTFNACNLAGGLAPLLTGGASAAQSSRP